MSQPTDLGAIVMATDMRDQGSRGVSAWAIVEGILLMLLGAVAIAGPLVTATATALLLPALLIVAGIVQIVTAFRGHRAGGIIWHMLLGIAAIAAGAALFARPYVAVAALPVIVTAWLVADGVIRLVAAASWAKDTPGRAWMVLAGLVSLGLAALLWFAPFGQTLVLIGLFIGVDILMAGLMLVVAGVVGERRWAAVG